MCGISAIFGRSWTREQLAAMHDAQRHRGPDAEGTYVDPDGMCGLAHNRLSIIDLSPAGRQPLTSNDGSLHVMLNGEIYNYLELRQELGSRYKFRTSTDTEVIIAAIQHWGASATLDRLIGMFALVVWDERTKTGFAARDRFGVKPLYYSRTREGTIFLSSEIKAIHAAGFVREPDSATWSTYLTYGLTDCTDRTFWKNINSLRAGHFLTWKDKHVEIRRWYSLEDRVGREPDRRDSQAVAVEYLELLEESVRLRFRADVPVGINLSGGLDSSTLLSLVQRTQDNDESVKAFTFISGDDRYDELPWVQQMIGQTRHPLVVSELSSAEVPDLAASVQKFQDEPYGGLPTLAYAKLFETARANDVKVLLDGNGMDEQWAGYDYYAASDNGQPAPTVQGSKDAPVRPDCLDAEFRQLATRVEYPRPFEDRVRDLQYRDAIFTKIPRAMRFNDRISMRSSTELREPFLDHRLFELAMRQPTDRKISNGTRKKMLRDIVRDLLPGQVSEAPKRPLQTPQREWLRGPLRGWTEDLVDQALSGPFAGWLQKAKVERELDSFLKGNSDNSFYVWQWISLGLGSDTTTSRTEKAMSV